MKETKKKELNVNETFTVQCKETKLFGKKCCDKCLFGQSLRQCPYECRARYRADGKNVHFEIVPAEIKESLTTEELEAKAKGFADFYLIEKEYDFERHSLEFGYIKGYEASHRKQRGRTAPNRALIDTLIKRACDWLCGNCEMCGDCEWQHSNTDCPTLKSMKTFMND